MQSHIFSAVVEADQFEDGLPAIHAWCPALKGCHTWGHNEREALARLEEAVELYLDDLRAAGEPIPVGCFLLGYENGFGHVETRPTDNGHVLRASPKIEPSCTRCRQRR